MPLLSFENLVDRFGGITALQCLMEIEKAARIRPSSVREIDPEIRLANALHVQDALMESRASAAA